MLSGLEHFRAHWSKWPCSDLLLNFVGENYTTLRVYFILNPWVWQTIICGKCNNNKKIFLFIIITWARFVFRSLISVQAYLTNNLLFFIPAHAHGPLPVPAEVSRACALETQFIISRESSLFGHLYSVSQSTLYSTAIRGTEMGRVGFVT